MVDKVKGLIGSDEPPADLNSGLSRRHFIRHFVVGTAVSTFAGGSWLATLVADCQPAAQGAGILRVRVSDVPALQNANGSVRLALNPFTQSGPTGAFYPVLINRGSNSQFFTLSTQCQHLSCVVPTFNATLGASVCPCHGSRYAINGGVLAGPTTRPLIAYTNNFDGTILCVEMPNLGYSVNATSVQSGVGPRLQLRFPTKSNVKYQVHFRPSVADSGTVVQFATTSEGAASSSVLTGNNGTATLFVDRTNDVGFYSVVVQVTQG
jgi:Rieske Fe-S protein